MIDEVFGVVCLVLTIIGFGVTVSWPIFYFLTLLGLDDKFNDIDW